MSIISLKNELSIRILNDYSEILKHLHIGINLPILSKFHKYILDAFKIFKPNAILVKKKKMSEEPFDSFTDKVMGNCIIFEQDDILFFGFFGVNYNNPFIIEFLVEKLLKYAKNNNYKCIRGPVNIPSVIYGYGFSVEKNDNSMMVSANDLFIACPISPLIYHQIFLKKGFYEKYSEDFYYMPVLKLNPLKLKYDYSNYEVLFPGRDKIWNYKDDVVRLHMENMPKESLITPKSFQYANIIINFIFDFGKPWMVWLVKYKPTNQIVGSAHIVPNVFGKKDNKGRYKTASIQHVVIDKNHQRRGLGQFLYGMGSLKATDRKKGNNLKYCLGIVASNNKPSIALIKKLGGQLYRRNIILECKL
ncbi:MAG: GNAT family N-acetyltransferase [Promethearchaeota archaeon]